MDTWIEFAGEMLMVASGNRYKIAQTDGKWVLRMGRAAIVCATLTDAKRTAANHASEWA